MKIAVVLGLTLPFALLFGCGGQVIFDRDGNRGGAGAGGDGGSTGDGGAGAGAGSCKQVNCIGDADACICETACDGPILLADCTMQNQSTLICECHHDGAYLGTCAQITASACSLPDGCCVEYLPH